METDVRIFVYDELVARGTAPKCSEIAARFGIADDEAKKLIGEIRIGKTLVTHPASGEIWMAGPFSAGESQYRLTGERTTWWARLLNNNRQHGTSVPLPQVWQLAKAWYADPRSRDWKPRSRDESQQVLASVGLTGDFWELPK